MKTRILILFVAMVALATIGSAGQGTLTASCVDTCSTAGGDPPVVITGTGFQSSGGHNTLNVVVYDSPGPVTCGTPNKSGAFTCHTNIDVPGWYVIVAYQNNKVIGSTGLVIY